jgi:hypothetical protein
VKGPVRDLAPELPRPGMLGAAIRPPCVLAPLGPALANPHTRVRRQALGDQGVDLGRFDADRLGEVGGTSTGVGFDRREQLLAALAAGRALGAFAFAGSATFGLGPSRSRSDGSLPRSTRTASPRSAPPQVAQRALELSGFRFGSLVLEVRYEAGGNRGARATTRHGLSGCVPVHRRTPAGC